MTSVDMVRLIQRTFPCSYVNSKNQQRSLVLLPKEYISDYATLLMSDDYNRNIDFNFSSSFKRSDLESLLYKMTENYFNPGYKFKDFRVILMDTATKKFIGCCVLCFSIVSIEISYYILPEFRGSHEAFDMLNTIILRLTTPGFDIRYIKASIRETNTPSRKLVERLGFRKYKSYRGKKTYNIEYRRYTNDQNTLRLQG